ncbi:HNH endonuclease family protein [Streptomyces cavernicola]|uniref:HNH endonuclease family protein n=1 Tax=Streptomyces cavernicola TaxID=3043613 RepID=A0ABT6S8N8_9ACTN|nr:HNH endonuclease family protein [Streptomyces sp. B-S-A6]MDI3403646.1 HNH endonuclease family protein [Streptomyces sp. B-S-A6]
MGRQQWWGRGLAVLAVLAVAGCSPTGGTAAPDATDGKPSASSSASDGGTDTDTGAGGGGGEEAGTLPGVPTVEQARTQLAALKVAPQGSMSGYSREKFPHWSEQGENCDTREVVLERDGTDVRRNDECRAVSGSWESVYDDEEFTDSSDLDIDHMVPLANAWRSGADDWTQTRREEFANDLTHPQLIAVSASSNRSKGDQGPDEWQPPAKTYWCVYGRAWVSVKTTYELTVTEAEKSELDEMLGTCGA